jgi:hypothetical protein
MIARPRLPSWDDTHRKWRKWWRRTILGPIHTDGRSIPDLYRKCPPEWLQEALEEGLDPNTVLGEDHSAEPDEDSDYDSDEDGGADGQTERVPIRWPVGFRALHYFVYQNDEKVGEMFLKHGADPNLYDPVGRTALHEAVERNSGPLVSLLLHHGAHVNTPTIGTYAEISRSSSLVPEAQRRMRRGDETALQIALRNSSTEAVGPLLHAGASLTLDQQPRAWTPMDIALLARDWAMMKELTTLGHHFSTASGSSALNTDVSALADNARDARLLLAMTRGDILIPSSSLHPIYCYALWRAARAMGVRHVNGVHAADMDELVCNFFIALESTASVQPQNQDLSITKEKRELCRVCLEFQYFSGSLLDRGKQSEFLLHQTRRLLDASADGGCPSCGIIADALDHEHRVVHDRGEVVKMGHSPSGVSMDLPVYLWIRRDAAVRAFGRLHVRSGIVMSSMYIRELTTTRTTTIPKAVGAGGSRDNGAGPDLSASLQKARHWLHTCIHGGEGHHTVHTHDTCREAAFDYGSNRHPRPRRLLHLDLQNDIIRLVEGEHVKSKYCALSYCWGTKLFYTTTYANLADNIKGFPLSVFPPLFRDAAFAAWNLGFDYIWIDALCIIQDSASDWEHESGQMGTIFANAELTISTLVARDCYQSLFYPWANKTEHGSANPGIREPHPVPVDIWQPKADRQPNTSLVVHPAWSRWPPDAFGPVHSRAWTLQEQLLSRRILWFGGDMLHWECLSVYKTEQDADEAQMASSSAPYRKLRRDSRSRDIEKNYGPRAAIWKRIEVKVAIFQVFGQGVGSSSKRIFDLWKDQLEEFMRRDITRSSDRLAAITSISQRLATASGNSFQDGLWVGDKLIESMCWRVVRPRPREPQRPNTNLPSWPWAAIEGEISFDLLKNTWLDNVKFRAVTLVSLGIQANESQGRVCSSITLKATLCRKSPWRADSLYADDDDVLDHLRAYYGLSSAVFLDHSVDDVADVYAFNLSGVPGIPTHCRSDEEFSLGQGEVPTIRYLMQKVPGQNTFRRVGIGILLGKPVHNRRGRDWGDMTPSKWLAVDEEVVEDAEIVIV